MKFEFHEFFVFLQKASKNSKDFLRIQKILSFKNSIKLKLTSHEIRIFRVFVFLQKLFENSKDFLRIQKIFSAKNSTKLKLPFFQ